MVVLRPDEELRELESLSMATKTMFCKREKVQVLNSKQQNDKHKQQFPYKDVCSAILGNVIGRNSTLILVPVHACISLPQVPSY